MIPEAALERAVAEAVVSAEQAECLRAIAREMAAANAPVGEPVDDEKLRFISGFADIFVTLGIVLFLGALAFLMDAGTGSTLMYAGMAACAWLLAEFFTAKRRMALPSIVLLVVFVGAIFMLSAQIAAALVPQTSQLWPNYASLAGALAPTPSAWSEWLPVCIGALVATAMAGMHYARFHVPITIAAGAAALCLLAFGLVTGAFPQMDETGLNVTLFVCGLAVFALAMRFDMSDPERLTRRTDIAFWLHLLAAPLIVHPLIRGFLHGMDEHLTTGAASGILWVFLALGAIAVVIDRRAILVSGLIYAGIAFGTIVRASGVQDYQAPTVLLALGAFILLLSAGWQPLRRAILRRLPAGLARRLPHPLVQSQA